MTRSQGARHRQTRRWPILVAALGALIAVAGCSAAGPTASAVAPSVVASVAPTVSLPTTAPSAAIPSAASTKPDGASVVKPNEAWIVYQTGDHDQDEVMLARPDGSGVHPLIPIAGPSRAHPDWSPDGSKILYQQFESVTATDAYIYVANADGSDAHSVFTCSSPGCNAWNFASWSPDGSSIVFQNLTTDAAQTAITGSLLQAVDVATGKVRTLLTSSDLQITYRRPRFSPDGKSLAFEVVKWNNPAGSKTRPLDASIVGSAIGVLDLTHPGAKPRLITDFKTNAYYPSWHPSGDLIIFNTGDPWGSVPVKALDLYTVKPDGSGQTQLTRTDALGGGAAKATWSTDGKRVLFEFQSGPPGVASVAADGSDFHLHIKVGEYPRLRPTS